MTNNIKLKDLTNKEQNFIYEVSRKFTTGYTMEEVAKIVGISRRTAFDWQKKYKELILEQKVEEFISIEDKVLKTASDLLESKKLSERCKGADLYFKITDILDSRAKKTPQKHEELSVENILKELGID